MHLKLGKLNLLCSLEISFEKKTGKATVAVRSVGEAEQNCYHLSRVVPWSRGGAGGVC